jgi:hypothetical protein
MKTCFRCGQVKAAKHFYKHKQMGDGRLNKCKECTRSDVALNLQQNPDRSKQRQQEMVYRDARLYNLLPGERQQLREFQNNRDPISGQPLRPNANLDHCHKTGLVRGLLNPLTNRFLIDDLDRLRKMEAYLLNPPAPLAFGEPVYGLLGKAQKKKVMKYGPTGASVPHPRRAKV